MQRQDHRIVVTSKSHTQSVMAITDTATQYGHTYSVQTHLLRTDTPIQSVIQIYTLK